MVIVTMLVLATLRLPLLYTALSAIARRAPARARRASRT
jgi:hypothetical protein